MNTRQKSRIEQRDEVFWELGFLLDPIRRLVYFENDPLLKLPHVLAELDRDEREFDELVRRFCKVGTLNYNRECSAILWALSQFKDGIHRMVDPDRGLEARDVYVKRFRAIKNAIRAVPCDDPDEILPTESPFQSYLRLRPIFTGVATRLHVFDPYLDSTVYHRYLAEVPDTVPIVVVTGEANMKASGGKATRRRRELVAVSELFAAERPTTYRFLVSPALHDRHLTAR